MSHKLFAFLLSAALPALAAVGVAAPAPLTLYVATNGNDHWSGRLATPNEARTDGPLSSLAGARDRIRAERLGNQPVPAQVLVRGGAYSLPAPFVLEPQDSGTAEAPVLTEFARLAGNPEKGQFVRHVTLRGLTFQHADWLLDAKGNSSTQAAVEVPATITADGALNCALEGCEVAHAGTYGIWFRRGCKDCRLSGSSAARRPLTSGSGSSSSARPAFMATPPGLRKPATRTAPVPAVDFGPGFKNPHLSARQGQREKRRCA